MLHCIVTINMLSNEIIKIPTTAGNQTCCPCVARRQSEAFILIHAREKNSSPAWMYSTVWDLVGLNLIRVIQQSAWFPPVQAESGRQWNNQNKLNPTKTQTDCVTLYQGKAEPEDCIESLTALPAVLRKNFPGFLKTPPKISQQLPRLFFNKVENPHNGPSAILVLKGNWFCFKV